MLTNDIQKRIEKAFNTIPEGKMDMPKGRVYKSRRL
jgi:hypothetical protein